MHYTVKADCHFLVILHAYHHTGSARVGWHAWLEWPEHYLVSSSWMWWHWVWRLKNNTCSDESYVHYHIVCSWSHWCSELVTLLLAGVICSEFLARCVNHRLSGSWQKGGYSVVSAVIQKCQTGIACLLIIRNAFSYAKIFNWFSFVQNVVT